MQSEVDLECKAWQTVVKWQRARCIKYVDFIIFQQFYVSFEYNGIGV